MSSETHDQQPEELRIVGKKYIGRWISALIVLLILLAMGNSMLSNPRFEWSVIAENFTGPSIIQGVLMTLQLTAISVIFGFAGGTVLALMRLSSNPVLVAVSWGYTWFFRGCRCWFSCFSGTTLPRFTRIFRFRCRGQVKSGALPRTH
jgi:polar amino acid transport system permease protein